MKKLITIISLASLCVINTGCMKDKQEKPNFPSKEEYFNFSLRESVKLDVNYYVPGLSAVIEVFSQDPATMDESTAKPIYVAYTEDGKYSGNMVIPTNVTEAYVRTKSISAPKSVKLSVNENGYTYDASQQEGKGTRNTTGMPFPNFSVGLVDKTIFPYEVAATANNGGKRNDNLYSITAWTPSGWECLNLKYYSRPATIGAANEKIGDVTARIMNFMEDQRKIDNNKSLLRNPSEINIKVPSTATDGMSVNVTYVGEQASFYNTLGYYYYEDNGRTLSPEEFYKIRKYIIIPDVEDNAMTAGETLKLLYFDNNGVQSDKFPANYVIGWFVIANGFGSNHVATGQGGYPNGGVIKTLPADAYTSGTYSAGRFTCMSDDTGNDRRFVSLYDTKSKLIAFGIEDGLRTEPDDYMDVVFIAQTSIDLGGGTIPPIGPEQPPVEPAVWSVSGTIAYEDIWPHGGDYDLNDVIVEYNRDITFGKDNIVTNIKDSFKPVQKRGSAGQDNYFACNYTNMGKVTPPAGVIVEQASGSVVVEASAKVISGNTYTIERDMSGLSLKQEAAQTDFNPYIITRSFSSENRIEVHLPMHEMTSAADKSLMTLDNAYYIAKDKIYPFAIDIPISGFIPSDETQRIDSPGQYPSFRKWAESKGKENKDWYLQDKGKK